jgi:hypothetical protein
MDERMATIYKLADKVATLSTGVLAFTITFAKNTVLPAASHHPCSLKVSWLCFLLAISGFFLIYLGKSALEGRILAALRAGGSGVRTIVPPWYFHVGRWCLGVGFLGGIACLAVYGFQSL